MTTEHDWKPSEAMVEAIVPLLSDYHSKTTYRLAGEAVSILLVARDLIIAEEKPKIEAAERERVLEEAAQSVMTRYNRLGLEASGIAFMLRSLKDKP